MTQRPHDDGPAPGGSVASDAEGERLWIAAVRVVHSAGRRAYPTVALEFGDFADAARARTEARLRRSRSPGGGTACAAALHGEGGADLYLATACEARAVGAWETLTAQYTPRLAGLAAARGLPTSEALEVAREALDALYAPPARGGAATGLGTYDGSVQLFSWLAVILLRRLVDRARARRLRREDPIALESGGLRSSETAPAAVGSDPLRRLLDAEAALALDEAFREAWKELTPAESLAVLLKYRDDLPQTAIARVLDIGEPRVSRILSAALEKIRAAIRRRIPEGLGIDADRVRPTLRDVVASTLASSGSPPELPRGGSPPP